MPHVVVLCTANLDGPIAQGGADIGPLLAPRRVGVTLQVDEGAEVFDAKLGNLHALNNAAKNP